MTTTETKEGDRNLLPARPEGCSAKEVPDPLPRRLPLRERINVRLLVVLALILLPVGWMVYTYVYESVTGGIVDYGQYVKVDLKAMSLFPFDQVRGTLNDIPPQFRELDGKRVLLEGEMYMGDRAADEADHFDLVYSIAKCCFSGPPQVQHFVRSRVRDGRTVGYYQGLVEVMGTLHVKIEQGQGKIAGVYHLDVESTRPVR